jgi:hypothetical protein
MLTKNPYNRSQLMEPKFKMAVISAILDERRHWLLEGTIL